MNNQSCNFRQIPKIIDGGDQAQYAWLVERPDDLCGHDLLLIGICQLHYDSLYILLNIKCERHEAT